MKTFLEQHGSWVCAAIVVICMAVLVSLPFVMSWVYQAGPKGCIVLTTGELVAYYGTVGAVVGAVVSYAASRLHKLNDEHEECIPRLVFEIVNERYWGTILVHNMGTRGVKDVRLPSGDVIPWLAAGETVSISPFKIPLEDNDCVTLMEEGKEAKYPQSMNVKICSFDDYVYTISYVYAGVGSPKRCLGEPSQIYSFDSIESKQKWKP